jgi:exopolysaccharide production protein ExoZ
MNTTTSTIPVKLRPYGMLDAWRGFAALWVVAIHACLTAIVTRYPDLRHEPVYRFSLLGCLGVPMFFVISGYCIANAATSSMRKDRPHAEFVKARFRRIYPPYMLASLLAIVLSLATQVLVARGILKSSGLSELNFLHHRLIYYVSIVTLTQQPLHQKPLMEVFWTLSYEVAFYAILAVGIWVVQHRKDVTTDHLLVPLHALTIGSLLILIVVPQWRFFPLDYWPQFGIGILVYDILLNPSSNLPRILFGIVAMQFILFSALYNYGVDMGHVGSRWSYLFTLGFAALLLALYRHDATLMQLRAVRAFASLGTFSYSLYLVHLLALGLVYQLSRRFGITEQTYIVSFLLQIAAAIPFSWFFYQVCERPFLRGGGRPQPRGPNSRAPLDRKRELSTAQ